MVPKSPLAVGVKENVATHAPEDPVKAPLFTAEPSAEPPADCVIKIN